VFKKASFDKLKTNLKYKQKNRKHWLVSFYLLVNTKLFKIKNFYMQGEYDFQGVEGNTK
jgi:hypothetical protein